MVSRPVIPLEDIGYLPGTKRGKAIQLDASYLLTTLNFCAIHPARAKGTNVEMESKKIEMEAVTYIRGRSLPKMFIIIDEAQNLTPHEVKTIVSRAERIQKRF